MVKKQVNKLSYTFYKTIYKNKKYDRYIIVDLLGEGRYGLCFLAKNIETSALVVIKKLKYSVSNHSQKHIPEGVFLSQLNHKNIPQFLGVINSKNFYAYVFEFIEGDTINHLLFEKKHKFNNKEIYNIGIQLIEIIKFIHSNNIIHKDISISNVILNKNELFLIDFGLARQYEEGIYSYDMDFSHLGDFLLYLLYSSYEVTDNKRKLPWYEELPLKNNQIKKKKKLLGIEEKYKNTNDVLNDFIEVFKIYNIKE